MYEMEIEDLKYDIKELKKRLKNAESDYEYECIEDEIFEKECRIEDLENEIENLKANGNYWSDDDIGLAEYGMRNEEE